MKTILTILFLGVVMTSYTQEFEMSTELRPRFEYRHGYKTLIPNDIDAASFISQRTRLNFNYKSDKLNAYVAFQNVRVWGDVTTTSLTDKNGITVHEAWAQLLFNSKLSLKLGRQEINYDDQRLFGSVGWAQQARSHDALIVTYKPNANNRLDLGLAMNETAETLFETNYTVNNYKAFQYVWYHTSIDAVGLSFLLLNNGLAYEDTNNEQKVDYNQTIGSRFTFEKDKFNADASVYFQTGKIADTELSAFNVAANASYKINAKFKIGLGAEYLSGTDMNATENTLKSFNPWFGTNHKFNGLMDYFYVGNHTNSVGLLDINATFGYQKDKFSATLVPHLFSSAATVIDNTNNEMSNSLGTELDLIIGYKWTKDISFNAGYSQMFATETMEVLKAGNKDNTNNWAWVMITIKPSLFKTTFDD
ncbi:alginate export family protein [Winogradskyella sp. F6397]|uniref:Alginate export family protein n=1 Tax=Winogradskyella marina TaxID=2785530 RepID=A0ABS0EHE0_9FLAO|nr:alginate export family protein [Winogradskyella marina]MBF8149854.1 alginate export family protein [Winogradskyella marina]